MKKKVWFVTGASKGLGLSLVKRLLQEGYAVAATSRNIKELQQEVGASTENFLPLQMDLLSEESVRLAIEKTIEKFRTLDVVVNNAGYGLAGAIEELSDRKTRGNFDVNVFGLLNVIRVAMPHLRRQQSGHIFNIASIAGFTGAFPGFGIYCATKFAVHGLSESLAEEVKPFNVKVTIVSPGYFRTKFLESGSLSVPKNEIKDYKTVREIQSLHQNDYNGNQQGDPDKAADAMINVAESTDNVLHLFLGPDAYQFAEQKMLSVKKDLEAVRVIGTSTSFA
ncbi:SDR family oxidoreductase [Pseudochryseolinea flava]|uniref:Short-chain dehydrogenase/reductase n=1 Tax=Pseudochryseolinea flava TaxID=2059302 RepID=A0A364XWJ1_9BACT|nr:SDR family oxidoreductase [Pseudochryseolinea flava]RAV98518.1 short-chain dehydrogenase/reductase [Pseudochryseolinea flava]